jgi:uncharacterized RDD family membrane protein YckC
VSGTHEERSGNRDRSVLADVAARAALFPARAAAHVWRDQIEEVLEAVLSAPETARAVDRALAGPLPEEIARSVVRHHVLERILADLAASGELERVTRDALASPRTREIVDGVLASDEMRRVLGEVVSAPEVRHAMAEQTAGLSNDVLTGLRAKATRVDERVDRRRTRAPAAYAGLATRGLALVTDVLVVAALYMSIVGVASVLTLLVGSLRPQWLVGALLTSGWAIVSGGYFVLCWSTAGRTPGMQLFRLRVRPAGHDGLLSAGRSIVRMVGLLLSIVPLFAGFLPVLFDSRRRSFADLLAGTVVLYDDPADG